jgi:hypothetical protein
VPAHLLLLLLLQSTLEQLQISTDAVARTQATPIGKGGMAKVYKAQFRGQDCATKVRYTVTVTLLVIFVNTSSQWTESCFSIEKRCTTSYSSVTSISQVVTAAVFTAIVKNCTST